MEGERKEKRRGEGSISGIFLRQLRVYTLLLGIDELCLNV